MQPNSRDEVILLRNSLAEVDKQRDELQRLLDQRCEQNDSLTSQNSDLHNQLASSRRENITLRSQLDNMSATCMKHEKEIQSLAAQLHDHFHERTLSTEKVSRLEAEVSKLKEDLRELLKENQSLITKNSLLTGNLASIQHNTESSALSLSQMEQTIHSLNSERIAFLQHIESLMADRATLQSGLQEADAVCNSLRQAVEVRDVQIDGLTRQLHEAHSMNHNLADSMETAHLQFQSVANELSTVKEALLQIEQCNQQLLADRDAQTLLHTLHSEQHVNKEKEVAKLLAANTALQEQRDLLMAKATAVFGLAKEERGKVAELENLLAEARTTLASDQEHITKLRGEITIRDEQLSCLRQQLETLEIQCKHLLNAKEKAELDLADARRLAARNSQASSDTDRIQARTKQLDALVAQLEIALQAEKEHSAHFQNELARLRATIQSPALQRNLSLLESEVISLRKSYSSLLSDHQMMKKVYASLLS